MSDAMRERLFDVLEEASNTCPDDWNANYWEADAIIAALPDMVPELVWMQNGSHWAGGYGFVVRLLGKRYILTCRNRHGQEFDTLEAAKAAANAHHRAQIMKALGIAQEAD